MNDTNVPTTVSITDAFARRIAISLNFSISGKRVTARDRRRITGMIVITSSTRASLLLIRRNRLLTVEFVRI